MKKLLSLALISSLLSFSGCALLLIGGAATGGYALSTDSAEGIVDHKYSQVWDAVEKVFNEKGIVTLQDEKHGRLEAEVDGIAMKAYLDRVGKDSSKLKISGRKNFLPKAKQAEEIFVKILQAV